VVLPLPNIHLVDAQQTKKECKKGIGGGASSRSRSHNFLTVGLVGFGEIEATFTADYGPGKFENLRVGMSKWQAAQIAAGVSPLLTWNVNGPW
jgi:hypothetical protein